MAKRQNWQLVKKNKSYTTSELAKLFDMSRGAIKYWVKIGLKPINPGGGTYYFMGEVVIEFLKKKNMRHTLDIDVFKCFKCKGRHRIKSDEVTILYTNISLGKDGASQVQIIGECENCGGKVTKVWSDRKLDEFLKHYPGIRIIKKVKCNK